jgi:hypothetical protein
MHNYKLLFLVFIVSLSFCSCKKDKKETITDTGKLVFKFVNYIDGQPLQEDTMKYVNAANNLYSVSEVKYFVSEVTLHKSDGTVKTINEWEEIHYIDEDLPNTKTWNVYDKIAIGNYDSITFIFGIRSEKNKSFMFVNPPEVNMMWPDILGGGYHYLMINGFWKDSINQKEPYNFHMGIGQIYKGPTINTDSIIGYIDNSFKVNLPASSFNLQKDETREIQIIMNIDSWFKTPHIYDHNYWGGAIMQNQPAMHMAKENGWDVFSIGYIK